MSWQDRLKESISLTSPSGSIFTPNWQGNEQSAEKKLGIFEYPDVTGTDVQDIGTMGTRYSLTLLFAGPDNDLEVARFIQAFKETGVWAIEHPVFGTLTLQPASITPNVDPTESGGLTVVESEWIEPLAPSSLVSTPQLAASIENQSDTLNEIASDQFVNNIAQDKASETLAVESATNEVTGSAVNRLRSLYQQVPELNAQILSIVSGIQDTITQTTIDTASLAGQIQNLVQLPALATTDIGARLTAYNNMIGDIIAFAPIGTRSEDKNRISVQELTLTAAVVALAQIVSSGPLQTRGQAIEGIESISGSFDEVTNGLDTVQSSFETQDIDLQYFSQSDSYPNAMNIIASGVAYLLVVAFDLAVEKRIIVGFPTSPMTVTVDEYGTLGPDDENYHLFVDSNKLKDNEILILPAGREVVVYV